MMGRFGAGHACPVAADEALTAAHVVDLEPLDPRLPLSPPRWEDFLGNSGHVVMMQLLKDADVAIFRPDRDFKGFYPIAKTSPGVGDELHVTGYDLRGQNQYYGIREWDLKVIRLVAGHLILKPAVDFGTSGSCVLNDRGEVVGIVSWINKGPFLGSGVTGAVGVWGEWRPKFTTHLE